MKKIKNILLLALGIIGSQRYVEAQTILTFNPLDYCTASPVPSTGQIYVNPSIKFAITQSPNAGSSPDGTYKITLTNPNTGITELIAGTYINNGFVVEGGKLSNGIWQITLTDNSGNSSGAVSYPAFDYAPNFTGMGAGSYDVYFYKDPIITSVVPTGLASNGSIILTFDPNTDWSILNSFGTASFNLSNSAGAVLSTLQGPTGGLGGSVVFSGLPAGFYSINSMFVSNSNPSNRCDLKHYGLTILNPNVRLAAKALLSGPFNTTSLVMNDDLRTKGYIPLTEPYTAITGSSAYSGFTIPASVLSSSVNTNDDIVDWVYLELRGAAPTYPLKEARPALIQRDGDIVDIDGISSVNFIGTPAISGQNLHVVIRHRNHLGVMTANPLNFSTANITPVVCDFTSTLLPLYNKPLVTINPPTRIEAGKRTLFAGNCNYNAGFLNNQILTYNSTTSSDRSALLLAAPGTTTISGYSKFDLNMDGIARFNGLVPDRLVLLINLGNSNTAIFQQHLP